MKTYTLTFDSASAANHIRRWIWISALGGGMILAFTSCKYETEPLPELKADTYTSSTLSLTYDGEAMPGKSAKIEYTSEPGSNTPSKAEITLYSEFDLSQLTGMGLTGSVKGPGVLPGSPMLTLTADLQPGSGCYTFSGEGRTDNVDYKYSGSIRSDLLEVNFTGCSLKSQVLAGKVFSPAPIVKKDLLTYESLPFHLVWELDPAAGIDIPLSDILTGIVTAPVIPVYNNTAYTSVALLFDSAVKTIALNPDGNIPVVYISTVGGAAHLATTTGNMLQYVPVSGGMKLYVNPLSALSQMLVILSKPSTDAEFVTKATDPASTPDSYDILNGADPKLISAFAKALVATVSPQLSEGIYLTVMPTSKGADIYFDTRSSVTFISALMQNLLSEPEIASALQEYLGSLDLPDLSQEELAGLLQQLPGFLEKTTKLEVGLSLVNYTGK